MLSDGNGPFAMCDGGVECLCGQIMGEFSMFLITFTDILSSTKRNIKINTTTHTVHQEKSSSQKRQSTNGGFSWVKEIHGGIVV